MNGNFAKGLIIGGLVGVSAAMIKESMMDPKVRRKVMRPGRNFMRRSGRVLHDVVDLFR